MQNVQENLANVNEALQEVRVHCMCAHFEEDPTHYRVLYPAGMCLDGAQISKGMGKAKALSLLLNVMERHWKQSGIQ
jgi:hypothetical protein